MSIPLVQADDVKTGRGGRTKGEKYGKYAIAVQKHLTWLKESIGDSKDGCIRMKVKDFAKELGKEFETKNETSIYWALKYVMFNEGVVVETGTSKAGDKLLLMRLATDEDKLPPSLSKFLEPPEEDDTTLEEDVPEDEITDKEE